LADVARGLFLRALLAFLLLPGTFAFAIPLLLVRPRVEFSTGGLLVLLPGIGLLLWCVREFYVAGRGTLAPWSPPRHLVVTGPYRVSRNPMYVAILLILMGWAIAFRSPALALYAAVAAAAFHLRIVLGEEPWLARAHGAEWTAYRAAVRRWAGRRARFRPSRQRR